MTQLMPKLEQELLLLQFIIHPLDVPFSFLFLLFRGDHYVHAF